MCGPAIVGAASSLLTTAANVDAANKKDRQDRQDAAFEMDAVKANVEQISRARKKRISEARAATAASGTALDRFSEINFRDIEEAGALDEQMTLLTGRRREQAMVYGQGDAKRAAILNGIGDLMSTAYQSGWKGQNGGGG